MTTKIEKMNYDRKITYQNDVIARFQNLGSPNETSTPVGNLYHKQSDASLFNDNTFVQTEINCDFQQGTYKDSASSHKRMVSQKKTKSSGSLIERCERFTNDGDHFNSSLEDQVFHDVSYTRVAAGVFNSPIISSLNNLHKLNGTTYFEDFSDFSDTEIAFNKSTFVNHQRRSQFRQNRRDWYLNRRRAYARNNSGWIQVIHKTFLRICTILIILLKNTLEVPKKIYVRYFNIDTFDIIITYNNYSQITKTIISRFLSTYNLITKKTLANLGKWLFLVICAIVKNSYDVVRQIWFILKISITQIWYKFKKSVSLGRAKSNTETSSTESLIHCSHQSINHEDGDNDDEALFLLPCCCMLILPVLILAPLILLVLGFLSQANTYIVPDPNLLGISKSQILFLGTIDENIPAWHFMPPSPTLLPLGDEFEDKSPVVFYSRETTNLYGKLQKNIFRTLVSLGYHVIVPVHILNHDQVSIAWSHVNKKVKSSVYLWGDHIDTRVLTGYAKDFCSQLIPPSGVILETKVKTPNYQHRSLEIWSCNCTYVENKKDGSYHKYTHVKCPVNDKEMSQEQLYNHIISCIEAVNREAI